jgi:hypothetical protein
VTLEERAALAARPAVQPAPRHRLRGRLTASCGDDLLLDELDYRATKSAANQAVDDFITAHRDG